MDPLVRLRHCIALLLFGSHTCEQMKYTLRVMFCWGKVSSSNSNQWKERIIPYITSIMSTRSLVEGLEFPVSVGLAWNPAFT